MSQFFSYVTYRRSTAYFAMHQLSFEKLEHDALCADSANYTLNVNLIESMSGADATDEAYKSKCLARSTCCFLDWQPLPLEVC